MDYHQLTSTSSFFLIAGPCVVENKTVTYLIAETLADITKRYQIPFIF